MNYRAQDESSHLSRRPHSNVVLKKDYESGTHNYNLPLRVLLLPASRTLPYVVTLSGSRLSVSYIRGELRTVTISSKSIPPIYPLTTLSLLVVHRNVHSSCLLADMSTRNAFLPSSQGDSRSPCPALNALANHSYMYVSTDLAAFVCGVDNPSYVLPIAHTMD